MNLIFYNFFFGGGWSDRGRRGQGESEGARAKHGAAEWKKPQVVVVDATLVQYPTLGKFQQKTVEFTLKSQVCLSRSLRTRITAHASPHVPGS
jgi:hypothetical protein